MFGFIKNYNEEKGFGFIETSDKESYFFHKNDVTYTDFKKNDFVSFSEGLSRKGPFAKNIQLNKENVAFEVPSEVYLSKTDEIKGWETLEETNWMFHTSSRSSPDSAKRELIKVATSMNANAILNLTYYTSTGSESGTGKGTHYYTIHNYSGNLANIAKKSLSGKLNKNDIIKNIQKRSDILYKQLQEDTKKSIIKSFSIWGFIITFILLCCFVDNFMSYVKGFFNIDYPVYIFLPMIIFGFMFGQYTDYTKNMTK